MNHNYTLYDAFDYYAPKTNLSSLPTYNIIYMKEPELQTKKSRIFLSKILLIHVSKK